MSYKFVPEKTEPEYTERMKEIIQEYEAHGFEWKPDPDEDMETFKEWNFEAFAKNRPETVTQEILSVYRLRDEYSDNEWLLYKIIKRVKDKSGRDYDAEIWMGKRPRFETRNITDEEGQIMNKVITNWNMEYTIKWDPKTFEQLIRGTNKRNIPCYIAYTSDKYKINHSGTPIMIKDMKLFQNATYDELLAYDRKLERERLAREPPVAKSVGK